MATTLLKNDLPEEIYKKSKALNREQVSQVLDFIKFLELKEKKVSEKIHYLISLQRKQILR